MAGVGGSGVAVGVAGWTVDEGVGVGTCVGVSMAGGVGVGDGAVGVAVVLVGVTVSDGAGIGVSVGVSRAGGRGVGEGGTDG